MRKLGVVLLLIPFVALLIPQLYAFLEPRLWGIPFFIWYQFLWVILGSILTGIVYFIWPKPAEVEAQP